MKTPKAVRPYYAVKPEYEATLTACMEAATMLSETVKTVLDLADAPGADLKRGIEMLREYNDAFRKARYGSD